MTELLAPLHFAEIPVERPWGGARLRQHFGKALPDEKAIGEIWLLSDQPGFESRVVSGPLRGKSLQDLLRDAPDALLGKHPRPTRTGRFPLLLKLLDVADWLSVQVHPGDADSERLNETDGGKTEMWHILEADHGAEILCGAEIDTEALPSGREWQEHLNRFTPKAGDTFFVPAGTVHAIGPGIVLAEIQQTSDLTYRVYDWDRDAAGRALHLEKAKAVMRNSDASGLTSPVPLGSDEIALCACQYFAAVRRTVSGSVTCMNRDESFHVLLNVGRGALNITAGTVNSSLAPGAAAFVPGCNPAYSLSGDGVVLDYFVPGPGGDFAGVVRAPRGA